MSNAIHPIPAFSDNYIWAIQCADQCLVVDPGDATPVFSYLEQTQLKLAGILITHHHPDHTGGLNALLEMHPDCPVYGPKGDHIRGITEPVGDGDQLTPLPDLTFQVLTWIISLFLPEKVSMASLYCSVATHFLQVAAGESLRATPA